MEARSNARFASLMGAFIGAKLPYDSNEVLHYLVLPRFIDKATRGCIVRLNLDLQLKVLSIGSVLAFSFKGESFK